jgi:AraC-like DNA-binding protein
VLPDTAECNPSPFVFTSRIGEVLTIINEIYAQRELSLATLAAATGLSERHLRRLLRSSVACSFTSYVRLLRLRHAQIQLSTTTLTTKQVCAAVGYSDVGRFARYFRDLTGSTPSEYRRKRLRQRA